MKRLPIIGEICLLISGQADRRLLSTLLEQTGYSVHFLTPDSMELDCTTVSMMIVDEYYARRHRATVTAIKRRCLPLYLPILMTLTGTAPATPWLRAGFDDVLRLPVSKQDLLVRMDMLLQLRRFSEQLRAEGEQRYKSTFDLAPVGILQIELNGRITLFNACFSALTGVSTDPLVGRQISTLVDPADRDTLMRAIALLTAGHSRATAPFDLRLRRSDEAVIWTVVTLSLVVDQVGAARHLIAIVEDISSRKQMENTLRDSEIFIKSTIDALSEHICVIDQNGHMIAANRAWKEFVAANSVGSHLDWINRNYFNVGDDAGADPNTDAAIFSVGMREVLAGERDEFVMEYRCDGATEFRWFIAKVTRFRTSGPVRAVISHENITAAKLAQNHLSFLAHYDILTGLPNRGLFYERLDNTLLQATRSNWTLGVMFVDLDHFKLVNDTMGHAAGDQLLLMAGQRLVSCLRSNDTVGRLGGDEFGVFLPDLGSEKDASLLANKIMTALAAPFHIQGVEAFVTCSIGIAIFPNDGAGVDILISSADTAMYRAKQLGRNGFQYFTEQMNNLMLEHARLETGLRRAHERGELFLEYQPQRAIGSGCIVGVEALMRWRHPELGMIAPADFIPIAEETGVIVKIGEWALRAACAQNKLWQEAGLPPVVIAVNLSARQFKHSDLSDMVEQVLRDTRLDGKYLELELTEGIVMEHADILIDTMHRLKAFGVRLSLDDFGTGYSNLAYLKRFPLDLIKIDKSFVAGIVDDDDDRSIAAAVITLGHSLKLKVMAEGVETSRQLAVLQSLGCDMAQGYLFSEPISASELTTLLEADRS